MNEVIDTDNINIVEQSSEIAHQEMPNEDYFECMNEYLDGNWCA